METLSMYYFEDTSTIDKFSAMLYRRIQGQTGSIIMSFIRTVFSGISPEIMGIINSG